MFDPEDMSCGVPLPPGIVRYPIEWKEGKFHSRNAVFDKCACWEDRENRDELLNAVQEYAEYLAENCLDKGTENELRKLIKREKGG